MSAQIRSRVVGTSRLVGAAIIASLVVAPLRARAAGGITVTDLGIVNSRALAMNDSGQVVGTGFDSGDGFLWDAGVATPLDIDAAMDINNIGQIVGFRLANPPGGNPTPVMWDDGVVTDLAGIGVAAAINDAAQVVGDRFDLRSDGQNAPVLWQGGTSTELPSPIAEDQGGSATDINEVGDIAGTINDRFANPHAVVWSDGVPSDLGPGEAAAINDAGQVAGSQGALDSNGNTPSAVLWDHGTVTTLGVGVGLGINEPGEVVGYRDQPDGTRVAMLWHDGVQTVLPTPTGSLTAVATDINNAGQIVGTAQDAALHDHAVMWTLTPTPATISIDVKPGSATNRISVRSHGPVTVALLATSEFDPATVQADTVCFGSARHPNVGDCTLRQQPRRRDVNHDGRRDLILRFDIDQTGIVRGDTEACVTGQTLDGQDFVGCDAITTR